MTRMDQHDQALETLGEFANEGNDNPRVIEAMGIATLRMPMLPTELPADRREMVLMAGRASYMMATRNTAGAARAFQALALRYPETPNVHYAYGVFLLQEEPDKAIDELKRELELQPDHPWSLMQIAYEYLKRGDAAGRPSLRTEGRRRGAARLPCPEGTRTGALETGDVDGAIKELLVGLELAPESPGLHFTHRACLPAGRPSRRRDPGPRRVH